MVCDHRSRDRGDSRRVELLSAAISTSRDVRRRARSRRTGAEAAAESPTSVDRCWTPGAQANRSSLLLRAVAARAKWRSPGDLHRWPAARGRCDEDPLDGAAPVLVAAGDQRTSARWIGSIRTAFRIGIERRRNCLSVDRERAGHRLLGADGSEWPGGRTLCGRRDRRSTNSLGQADIDCERLGLVELDGERVDARIPDPSVREVEADHLGELLRRLRAA